MLDSQILRVCGSTLDSFFRGNLVLFIVPHIVIMVCWHFILCIYRICRCRFCRFRIRFPSTIIVIGKYFLITGYTDIQFFRSCIAAFSNQQNLIFASLFNRAKRLSLCLGIVFHRIVFFQCQADAIHSYASRNRIDFFLCKLPCIRNGNFCLFHGCFTQCISQFYRTGEITLSSDRNTIFSCFQFFGIFNCVISSFLTSFSSIGNSDSRITGGTIINSRTGI